MNELSALAYSLLFGMLHGILPDEHTWPITFSYAIGGGSGKEGLKAGVYFSAAFTVQRAILSEVAYLALAPFLLSPAVNGTVYLVVGILMSVAGAIVLRRNRYPHFDLLGHSRATRLERGHSPAFQDEAEENGSTAASAPPVRWAFVHGFVAGFSFGGFSLFVNTVAAPAMSSAWLGFLPGLLFGLGTMLMLAVIGTLFGASLRWVHSLTEQEVRKIGSLTGGRTLFYGGMLFAAAGAGALLGLEHYVPVDTGYALIVLFMAAIAVPAFVSSWRGVLKARTGAERAGHGC